MRVYEIGLCRGGVLVLEHGADLLAQFRGILVAMYSLGVQNGEVQHVVFCI